MASGLGGSEGRPPILPPLSEVVTAFVAWGGFSRGCRHGLRRRPAESDNNGTKHIIINMSPSRVNISWITSILLKQFKLGNTHFSASKSRRLLRVAKPQERSLMPLPSGVYKP